MNTLLEKLHIWEYDRISIVSDAMSEYGSDILYFGIKEIMQKEIPQRFGLMRPNTKIHFLDEWEVLDNNEEKIPFRVIASNFTKKVNNGDAFLFRGMVWISMGGVFKGVPAKISHMSELILQINDNKLSIIKDRYRSEGREVDLKPFYINTKITKIINNING